MGTIKTKGIILSEHNMGDSDKMLTILTPGYGKIGCAAKGARRQKSLLLAGTQFLCFGEYILYKGSSEIYRMNSCETIEVFYKIRTDLEKLEYASFFTKMISDVTTENQNTYKILQLLLNTLYVVSEKEKDLILVTAIFKLRLLELLGFLPKIKQCSNCNQEQNLEYFSLKHNGFECSTCGKQDKSAIHMQEATKIAIQYILLSPPQKLFSFEVSNEVIKELDMIAKLYTNEKLEKEYKIQKLF